MIDPNVSTDILGVQVCALTMPNAIETIEGWIDRGKKAYVCLCNVHSVMDATRDPSYMSVLNQAGLRLPDGMPLVWLSRRAGHASERVCGPDLMQTLAARSGETGHRHYFYGGLPGVSEELARRLTERYPGLIVAGTHTPSMQPVGARECDETLNAINACRPDIVWVGLGSPKQDFWAVNHLDRLDASVVIAVGAAFDFHSGRIRRAPKIMQRTGTEWLFRLSQDPKRLWKRYLLDNSQFVILSGRQVLATHRPDGTSGISIGGRANHRACGSVHMSNDDLELFPCPKRSQFTMSPIPGSVPPSDSPAL